MALLTWLVVYKDCCGEKTVHRYDTLKQELGRNANTQPRRRPNVRCSQRAPAGLTYEWPASDIAEAECSSVDAYALAAELGRQAGSELTTSVRPSRYWPSEN